MVRIKNRYLLLNVFYPNLTSNSQKSKPDYLTFSSPTPDYVDAGRFVAHLRNHISLLFGDYGLGASLSSLKVVYFSAATSTAILRVPRNHHQLIWAALSHITELPGPRKGEPGRSCVIRVARVSGTIRKAEEELLRRSRRNIVRAKLSQESEEGDRFDKMLLPRKNSIKSEAKVTENNEISGDLNGSDEEMSD